MVRIASSVVQYLVQYLVNSSSHHYLLPRRARCQTSSAHSVSHSRPPFAQCRLEGRPFRGGPEGIEESSVCDVRGGQVTRGGTVGACSYTYTAQHAITCRSLFVWGVPSSCMALAGRKATPRKESARHGARPGPKLASVYRRALCVPRSRERERRPSGRQKTDCHWAHKLSSFHTSGTARPLDLAHTLLVWYTRTIRYWYYCCRTSSPCIQLYNLVHKTTLGVNVRTAWSS